MSVDSEADLQWRRQVFEAYAAERGNAAIPEYALEVDPDLARYVPQGQGDEAILCFARFPKSTADDRIAEELADLRKRGWHAEWKVHDFDEPDDLKTRLEASGLSCHHTEALMVLDVASTRPRTFEETDVMVGPAPADAIDEIAALAEEVWNCKMPWLVRSLRQMTDPIAGSASLYYARAADRVVGCGWIDFPAGARFAQLSGGAVLEAYRGRGLYLRLFEHRLAEARARGIPYLAVDAAPMSRPILEKRGFRLVCRTYPMRTRPYEPLSG